MKLFGNDPFSVFLTMLFIGLVIQVIKIAMFVIIPFVLFLGLYSFFSDSPSKNKTNYRFN